MGATTILRRIFGLHAPPRPAEKEVCWHSGHPTAGSFVGEAGTLDLVEPNPMQDARVSLTTTLKEQKAPIVISFRTASAMTGSRSFR